ncbi:hypothetical protein LTR04_001594 [Oleoguttula sp. CCFEE 6159]|nr:hypothetical protein LTR04_001594 [Oleoguttula sp. CCFEE 6159]
MPGSSLWLVPPPSSPIYKALQTLIDSTIPSRFPDLQPPHFVPHVTLTSDIPADLADPQALLGSIDLPSAGDVVVRFEALDVGEAFVKKLTLRVANDDGGAGVVELATRCRSKGVEGGDTKKAEEWARKKFMPHCSLLYSGTDPTKVEEKREQLLQDIREAGIAVGSKNDKDSMNGWTGGSVWFVPTHKSIEEWSPVAKRLLV